MEGKADEEAEAAQKQAEEGWPRLLRGETDIAGPKKS